ncbi:MAG: non-ribosomal peptide synthetase, partial [Gammaproteobacteria bacterium]
IKAITLAAYAHQDIPFEQVVEVIQPPRSLSHSPIFQVMLALNNTPHRGELTLPGLTLARVAAAHNTTQFDLSLFVNDSGMVIVGSLNYASELLERATTERLSGHLQTVLRGMVQDEQATISRLPLLMDSERKQLLLEFNSTTRAYPRDRLIHQLFEEQAVVQPDAIAVVYVEQSLSYGELNCRANQLAHRLRALGIGPDDRVAICVERSLAMVVGVLGTLKAGGAYVPLDPDYPAERLAYLLADSAPVAVLTQTELQARLPATDLPLIPLALTAQGRWLDVELARQPDTNPDTTSFDLTPEHLAYVMYTSGSTGLPKGVMVPHRGVIRLLINNPYVHITPADCIAHCANPAFDASTWETWGALLHGARLLAISQAVFLDSERFGKALIEGEVTALWLTVGLFNEYADALESALGQLDYLLIGGDALDPTTVARVLRRSHRPRHLINGYGPTETTTFATTYEITELAEDAHTVPIGTPIANTQIYILDPQHEPVPLGSSGEIYIGGAGVACGYLNRPELTAERFIADPFRGEREARLYRTGDLGRWLPDGNIEYLGRNDFQVKVRGFRIELGEIETCLAAHAQVREAVVTAREDSPDDKRVVAYVTRSEPVDEQSVAPDAEVTSAFIAALREHVLVQLPEYMVPSAFVVLETLPLTTNGKLDRRGLPAPDQSAVITHTYEPPEGPIETAVAQIWQELLGIDSVGRHDHFFELGGHSLLIVTLIERLRQQGLRADVRSVFTTPVLATFAATLSGNPLEPETPLPPNLIPEELAQAISSTNKKVFEL